MNQLPTVANYSHILPEMHVHRIQIICNTLHVKLDTSPKKVPKYKKVGKKAKQELLDLVEAGCSIVAAANKLNINYSTAKSIIQHHKKSNSLSKVLTYSTDESADKDSRKQELKIDQQH